MCWAERFGSEGGRGGGMDVSVCVREARARERKGLFPAILSDHPYRKYYTLSIVICVICVHF